ncbi:MAG: lipoprotein-releasing ABC transporter ATP-binding protein LolD [Gammaproteobacteria bacterium]|nr:lipoprotein-releasing ABC transporter ATP-binding protein LolD [Gammaproteobacteria bacterium]MBQ0838718.1 lipoprotein-releasing ABC transporter ATP-binding protein LolD [Gammaproteobacteria bacterium]
MSSDRSSQTVGDRQPVIACRGLSKSYLEGENTLTVLANINLTIQAGEKLAIIGASGSGKSTLLNMLGGLDEVSSGEVVVSGHNFATMSESQSAQWRNRQLGFVYQFHHLLGEFTALENVAMPLLIAGIKRSEAQRRARAILQRVGLGERLKHKPSTLSGGERQRVAIARAVVAEPSCVLMDEPTGNLDADTADTVLKLLLELNTELGISFVIVTHDRDIAAQMDRILVLEKGELRESSV